MTHTQQQVFYKLGFTFSCNPKENDNTSSLFCSLVAATPLKHQSHTQKCSRGEIFLKKQTKKARKKRCINFQTTGPATESG